MIRKTVEINGTKYTLGESQSGEMEDCQDTLANPALDNRTKTAAMRRFIVHCLNRGGNTTTAEALAVDFTTTESAFLFQHAMALSGLREVPKGEVMGP